ncbi:MAG TPA: glycosyltransferase family 4 protein [Candidatus Acidoferrales bacterium]|nr:glycosyltransferase family 4 protein [Candidatus Acidoferrales bacterium]
MSRKLSIFISHGSHYLTDHAQHGDGLVAYGFIRELARRGHELYVAAPVIDLQTPLPDNVHLYDLTARTGPGFRQLEYMVRSRALLDSIRRNHHIDLIHQLNPVVRGLSISMVGSGLPVVLGTFVGDWPTGAPSLRSFEGIRLGIGSAFKAALDIVQQQSAQALLITTPAARNRMPWPDAVAKKTFIVSHGIDATQFAPSAEADSNGKRILFLNGIWRHKGIYTLLDAFDVVARRVPDARLVIAGHGPESDGVRERAARSEAADRIEIVGRVDRTRVPEFMNACAVHCLPSFGEPYGQSVLEAMACGKPVVVTNTGGIRYLVPEGGGYKVPPGDAPALAEALVTILSSASLRAEMGAINRRVVEEQHRWERVGDRLEEVYSSVLRPDIDAVRKGAPAQSSV